MNSANRFLLSDHYVKIAISGSASGGLGNNQVGAVGMGGGMGGLPTPGMGGMGVAKSLGRNVGPSGSLVGGGLMAGALGPNVRAAMGSRPGTALNPLPTSTTNTAAAAAAPPPIAAPVKQPVLQPQPSVKPMSVTTAAKYQQVAVPGQAQGAGPGPSPPPAGGVPPVGGVAAPGAIPTPAAPATGTPAAPMGPPQAPQLPQMANTAKSVMPPKQASLIRDMRVQRILSRL